MADLTRMRGRAIPAILSTATALTVVTALAPATMFATVAFYLSSAVLCTLAWWASLYRPTGQRRWMVLMASALTASAAGNVLLVLVHRSTSGPDVVDLMWLTAYPLIFAALFDAVRQRAPGQLRSAVLDSTAFASATAVAAWQYLIAPNLAESGLTARTTLTAAYVLADLLVLAGALILGLSPGPRRGPTGLALGAAAAMLCADTLYGVLPTVTSASEVRRVDGLFLLSAALMVAAMLHPRGNEVTDTVPVRLRTLHPARVLLLGVALLTAPTVAALNQERGSTGRIVLLLAALTASALVLTRFVVAVREQERSQRLLAHQAAHDGLTGLANRAAFAEQVTAALPRAPVVLYIDLDGFKAINDTAGHQAGDGVLVAVAQRLSQATRNGDVVARLGGDEFAILCRDIDGDAATRIAARIIAAVAQPIAFQGTLFEVGASIGIAVADPAAGADEALRHADAAMYESKRHGRGRWTLAGTPALLH